MGITAKEFGKTKKNETVHSYTLKNKILSVEILSIGGVIRKIMVPDKNGENINNVVLGFDTVEDYEKNVPFFGCITGRVAGRIKNAKLKIENDLYELEANNGKNCLHGGTNSLHTKIWKGTTKENSDESLELKLEYISPHLENNFPAEIKFTVTYTLKNNELHIDYIGIPDRKTYMCLTNHSYFNLSGDCNNGIYDHEIKLCAENFLEVDDGTIPTKISKVRGSFDLREPKYFQDILLDNREEQIKRVGGGIDHGFVLSKNLSSNFNGQVYHRTSGRVLEFKTDQPAVVLYTGNYLSDIGRKKHSGFCIETQDYPDVSNILPEKYSVYSPEKKYEQNTIYKFYTK
ncbi:MAG: aldose epimerase family protein [Fusobacteriaceae bacterium]